LAERDPPAAARRYGNHAGVGPNAERLGESAQAKGAPVPPTAAAAPAKAGPRELLQVTTDLIKADIDTRGGDIVYLELLQQKDARDETRISCCRAEHRYAAQSGLIGSGLPNHRTPFRAQGKAFALAPGQDKVEVRLEASAPQGVKVTKVLTFYRGSYRIDVAEEIANSGSAPLATDAYFQVARDGRSAGGDPYMTQTYTGAASTPTATSSRRSRSTTSPRARSRIRRLPTTAGSP